MPTKNKEMDSRPVHKLRGAGPDPLKIRCQLMLEEYLSHSKEEFRITAAAALFRGL